MTVGVDGEVGAVLHAVSATHSVAATRRNVTLISKGFENRGKWRVEGAWPGRKAAWFLDDATTGMVRDGGWQEADDTTLRRDTRRSLRSVAFAPRATRKP